MRKLKSLVLVVVCIAAAGAAYLFLSPLELLPAHPYFTRQGLLVIAHRGGRGLWPENTLYGFRRAARLGVDILEMDIRATADGVLVVHHDEEVDRTTNGQGRVEAMTFEQLRQLDAGYTWTDDDGATFPYRGLGIEVPTLRDVLTTFPDVRLACELKPPSTRLALELCRSIRALGMEDHVLVASFHQEAMDEFRRDCPTVATAATPREAFMSYQLNRFHLDFLQRPKAEALQVPPTFGDIDVLTPRFLNGARKLNIQVHVWTINRVDDMKRVAALGVDGIMTDYPDRLLGVLGRKLGPIHREGDHVR